MEKRKTPPMRFSTLAAIQVAEAVLLLLLVLIAWQTHPTILAEAHLPFAGWFHSAVVGLLTRNMDILSTEIAHRGVPIGCTLYGFAIGILTIGQYISANEPSANARKLRVLLAEDSEMNQSLATIFLNRQGHQIVVANNGRDALAALESDEFDLVLMDVQMPEMSGLDATAAIREKERATGAHIPIIAMTALAAAHDREHCLAAGMDGYVSKPIRPAELFKTIDEVLTKSTFQSGTDSNTPEETEREDPLERSTLLASVGGNAESLVKSIHLFLSHSPKMLAEMRNAIDSGDGDALARVTHTLRGGAGIFLTSFAKRALTDLEANGRGGDVGEGLATIARLESEMSRIECELMALITEGDV